MIFDELMTPNPLLLLFVPPLLLLFVPVLPFNNSFPSPAECDVNDSVMIIQGRTNFSCII
jgi:hypothetical protein